jgi:hypothetical protein
MRLDATDLSSRANGHESTDNDVLRYDKFVGMTNRMT